MAIAGGFRVRMDAHYKNNAVSNMMQSLRTADAKRKAGNPAGALLHGLHAAVRSPFALAEISAKPLMEHWVPWLKAGAVSSLLQAAIDDLPAGANLSRDEVRKMSAQAVDLVDHRMGQLNYDNLFWSKIYKDAMLLSVRSAGWNIGSGMIIGGAAMDVATAPKRLLSGGGGGKVPPGGTPPGTPPGGGGGYHGGGYNYDPLITGKMAYAFAVMFVTALAGGLMTFLLTGRRPEGIKDLSYPRAGGMNDQGKPNRLGLPTYGKDVYGLMEDPKQTLINKVHPMVSTMYNIWNNRDYYGTEIRNPEAPWYKTLGDDAKYAGSQFVPFGVSNFLRAGVSATTPKGALSLAGLPNAPRQLDYTPAEKRMTELLHDGSTHTQEQAQQSKERRGLVQSGRAGESIRAKLNAAVKDGDMTFRQARSIVQRSHETWQVQKFRSLPSAQALEVFRISTAAEKRVFSPYLRLKERGQTRQFQAKAIEALRAMTR